MLELKKETGTDYVLSRESKKVYNSKLKPLYIVFYGNKVPIKIL